MKDEEMSDLKGTEVSFNKIGSRTLLSVGRITRAAIIVSAGIANHGDLMFLKRL